MRPPPILQEHPLRDVARTLCALIRAACPELTERVKWNAPSFGPGDDDRLTLNLSRPDRVRLILHRGARARDARGQGRLLPLAQGLHWADDNRAVLELTSLAALQARRDEIAQLCRDWAAASAGPS